jgi:hypothetical protein
MVLGFSEVYWTLVLTTASGILLAGIRMLYRSKCKSIKCCGCEIDRDTEAEEKEDIEEMHIAANNNGNNNVATGNSNVVHQASI